MTSPPPLRAAIYCRISQDRTGEALGVTRQLEDCTRLAETQGWIIHDVYTDNDISAVARKPRPEYRRMLKAIEAGEVDAIIAWHTDRLYRKFDDLTDLTKAVENRAITVRTVQAGEFDLNTATGRMVARLLATVSSAEGELKSERWRRSVRQRREQGRVPGSGMRMFGYTWEGDIVPDEAAVARWMAEEVLAGTSLLGLSKELAARGVKTTAGNPAWSTATIRRYLTNPRLAGYSHLKGDIIGRGTWTPILDEDTWETVRAVIGANAGRPQTPRSLLTGLLFCGRCEGVMSSGARMNKRKETVRVYRCNRAPHLPDQCGAVSGVAKAIEEIVEAYAAARLADPRVRAAIADLRAAPRTAVVDVTAVEARIVELERQLDRPGVPVETILRALDRAKERRDELLASLTIAGPRDLPTEHAAWPDQVAKRRTLIELVVARVTLNPATTVGMVAFDHERVKITDR